MEQLSPTQQNQDQRARDEEEGEVETPKLKSKSDFSCCPPPLFIPLAVLTQAILFFTYKGSSDACNTSSPLVYDPVRRYEVWRFLSYALVHFNIYHLVMNLLSQLTIGVYMEFRFKFWRIAPVFLLGIISGSLSSSVFDANKYLCGSSGGSFALVGSVVAGDLINWRHMYGFQARMFAVVRLFLSLTSVLHNTLKVSGDISIPAHLGGFFGGALLGVVLLRIGPMGKPEKIAFFLSIFVYLSTHAGAILFNAFCARYQLCPAVRFDKKP